jgi:hypothetical protein
VHVAGTVFTAPADVLAPGANDATDCPMSNDYYKVGLVPVDWVEVTGRAGSRDHTPTDGASELEDYAEGEADSIVRFTQSRPFPVMSRARTRLDPFCKEQAAMVAGVAFTKSINHTRCDGRAFACASFD